MLTLLPVELPPPPSRVHAATSNPSLQPPLATPFSISSVSSSADDHISHHSIVSRPRRGGASFCLHTHTISGVVWCVPANTATSSSLPSLLFRVTCATKASHRLSCIVAAGGGPPRTAGLAATNGCPPPVRSFHRGAPPVSISNSTASSLG